MHKYCVKRYLMEQLIAWKKKENRKPLILQGVRQTGKTYLLKRFGEQEFLKYHIINFEEQQEARGLFEKNLTPTRILDDLQFFLKTPINIQSDLVIFDEIQACPNALTSLKYFCEEMPKLALCSAGSLLGLKLGAQSYPVGKVDFLKLHPMTFGEFLMGIGDQQAAEAWSKINVKQELSEVIHQHLWEKLKHYFITGGLPEVVLMFTHTNDLYSATHEVRKKQEELINGYYADIAKHAGKTNSMHIDRVWRSIPQQLSQTQNDTTSRFRFKGIIPSINRYSQLVNVIDWLEASELIIKISIIDTVQQPLSAYSVENQFKLMMFDVGILGAMSQLDPKTILNYDYGSYKGYFAENFVAQQLWTQFPSLYSWHTNRSEVEFLLQHEGEVIPVEVKAGERTKTKSLQKFINKYRPIKSFILSGKNLVPNEADDSLQNIFRFPLYLTEKLLHDLT